MGQTTAAFVVVRVPNSGGPARYQVLHRTDHQFVYEIAKLSGEANGPVPLEQALERREEFTKLVQRRKANFRK